MLLTSRTSPRQGWFLSTRQGDDLVSKALETNPRLLDGRPEPYDVIEAYKKGAQTRPVLVESSSF